MATLEVGRKYELTYRQIGYKKEDWVDANKYRPMAFDLVYIKTMEDGKEIKKKGWWTGKCWISKMKEVQEIVTSWNRDMEI